MNIANIHRTRLPVSRERAACLLDGLASARDRLWPSNCWPALRLDWPLMVAARGGHGPIRYAVVEYQPGQRVRFAFSAPKGFNGWHEVRLEDVADAEVELVHELRMHATGLARLSWPVVFRPLHDALIEDAFALARQVFGQDPAIKPWSRRVRLLRFLLSFGNATPQSALLAASSRDPFARIAPPLLPAESMTTPESSS